MTQTISKSFFKDKEKLIKKAVIQNEKYKIITVDGKEFILIEDPKTIKNMAAQGDAVAAMIVSVTSIDE